MISSLKEARPDFHTDIKPEERVRKMVLNAAPNMETNDINHGMEEETIIVAECVPLRKRAWLKSLWSYLLTLPQVKKLHRLQNVMCTRKKNNWIQHHRYQVFGHGKR